jgi:hypothetical protein
MSKSKEPGVGLTKTMTIRWELAPGDIHRVMYFIDDSPVGEGDEGFDKILDRIRLHKNIQVTLKVQDLALAGGSLIDSFPFRERFNELSEELRDNSVRYEFA